MRNLITLVLLILSTLSHANDSHEPSACNITSFVAEYNLASCDGEIVKIVFNFTATEFGVNGFKIIGPMGTQTYELGDDYVYTVIANCSEPIELTLQDNNSPNCSMTIELEPECCPCEVTNIITETSLCNNGLFTLWANFNITSGSCLTNGWTVTACGNTYTMQEGPNAYFATGIVCTSAFFVAEFCSIETGECFTKEIENPCFGVTACELTAFNANYVPGGCSGEIKAIEFNFTGTGFGSNGYYVHNGSEEHFYEPGDPQIFETPAECDGPVQLTIVDADDASCTLSTTLDPACCPCEVSNIEVFTGPCNNGVFAVEISMDINAGSCLFGDWTLTVNNVIYPLTFGGTNWVATGISATDSLVTLEICNPNAAWCEIVIVPNPCWQGGSGNCVINSFTTAYDTSLCNGELAGIVFEINAVNFGSNGFTVTNGSTTETYLPGDDYVFYVPANCSSNVVLVIQDINNPACGATAVVAEACCPCEADVFQVWAGDCVNNAFEVLAAITIESGSCFFGNWLLIINNDTYPMLYNGNSWIAENVSSSDSLITAFICHPATAFCEQVSFVNPCYNGNTACSISNFEAAYSQNYCDGEWAGILFNVSGSQLGSAGFTVSGGGNSTVYYPGDDYLFFVPAMCGDSVLLTITDNADTTCTASYLLGPACCPCEVSGIEAETFDCINGSFGLEIFIGIEGGSCFYGPWTATVGNNVYPLTYNGLHWTATGITSADSIVVITICHPATGYCETIEIVNPCFNASSNCSLTSFTAAYVSGGCDGELTAISFAFAGSGFGTNGYYITSANVTQTYELGDSNVFYLPALCGDSVWLVISDVANSGCTLSTLLGPACCPCELDTIEVATGPCNGGSFNIEASLFITGGSCYFGDWTLTVEGLTYPLIFNNNGELVANISAAGQWVELIFCHTATSFCDTIIVENPCFSTSNNCVFNIESVALENVTTAVNGVIKLGGVTSCSAIYDLKVNGVPHEDLLIEDNYIFANGLPIEAPMYHFEVCNLDTVIVCADTTVVNPYYTVSTQENENLSKLHCQNNTVLIYANSIETASLMDLHGRILETWTVESNDMHVISHNIPAGLYIVTAGQGAAKKTAKCWIFR